MGVGVHSAIHLCKIAQKRPFGGSLLTLGVQDAHLTEQRLRSLALHYGLPDPPDGWKSEINAKPYFAQQYFITGHSLWTYLGFEEIVTLDVDDFESADVMFDLNNPDPPENLRDRFDVIFDGGTIEHIFHIPNALAALHHMVKPGGMIVHQTPSTGHPDHGFYMPSPTLFQDYYSTNGYAIRNHELMLYSKNSDTEPPWFLDYSPGCLSAYVAGGFAIPGMSMLIGFAAERLPGSTAGIIPQQSFYEAQWTTADKPGA